MKLDSLERIFSIVAPAYQRYQSVKKELDIIQEEIQDYLSGDEEWHLSSEDLPDIGQKVLTGEKKENSTEAYSVLIFNSNPEKLYKYWTKVNSLP